MAVSTTNAFDGPFIANGVATSFPFTFTAQTASDVRVLVDGADVSGYSVEIHADGGGTVSFDAAPATGSLLIWLDPDFTQTTAFEDGSAWLAGPVNAANDRAALRDQALARDIGRGFMVPPGESGVALPAAAARAGKYFAFDAQGAAVLLPGTSLSPAQAALVAMSGGDSVDSAVEAQRFPTVAAMIASTIMPRSAGRPWRAAGYAYVEAPMGVLDYHLATVGGVLLYVVPLNGSVSAEAFGAVCDGISDDSPYLQKAVDFAGSLAACCVYVHGDNLLNTTVIVSGSCVSIRGSNHGGSRIINGQTNSPALQFGDGTNIGYRNGVSGVIFGHKAGIEAISGNCGLYCVKQSNFVIDNVQAFQFPAPLYDCIVLDGCTQSYISNVGLQNAINKNLILKNSCTDIYANNGRCDGGAIGIEFRDVQGMYFSNFACYGNKQHGWSIVTDGITSINPGNRFFFFTNCVGDTSGSHNWNILQCSVGNFTGCWGSTQLSQGNNPDACGFYLDGTDVESLTFNGSFALSNNSHGMYIKRARRIHLSSCMLGSDYAPDDFGGTGANNGKGGAGSGLAIGSDTVFISAIGGHYEHNKSYGIDIALGAQGVSIKFVELRYNISGSIRNLANATASEVNIVGCGGYNPIGFITPPIVPPSGVSLKNISGSDAMVYISGGTVSQISVGGQGILASSPASVFVPAGDEITLTYSATPSWQWRGN